MKPLATPITELSFHYDVVVVGSGYGGGIAASRMARCGKRVCLLERGKEILTGEYPDTIIEASGEFQLDLKGVHSGSPTGLYDLRINDDINVFVGCGLGGTSLVNANVSLRADERVFEDPRWPQLIHGDPELARGYERAERMLAPTPYPNRVSLNKLKALQTSAQALGRSVELPPINVNFEDGAINNANVAQPECTLCGDCCSGCNIGAKNTTLVNYLPDAVNHGAEIFTEVKVHTVRKTDNGWNIFYQPQNLERLGFDAPELFVSADIVILAAGTLGSTEILLRSRQAGLALSDRLGKRFTGNGDVLAFGYNNDIAIDGVGVGEPAKVDTDPVGPCITGVIDMRDTEDFSAGMVIEEGSLPSSLAPILPTLMAATSAVFGKDTDGGFTDYLQENVRILTSLAKGAYDGAVNNTQTFLVMSHDDGAGEMRLEDDRLEINWPGVASQPVFATVDQRLHKSVEAMGGTYVKNPMSQTLLGSRLITVHPLGGCIIGTSSADGVVNHKSQVFDPSVPDGVHEGLYVCDGAVIPSPLGVNPLLTISALAERAMSLLAADHGLTFDEEPTSSGEPRQAGASAPVVRNAGLQFTERMAGYFSTEVTGDYQVAARAGREEDSPFEFVFTIVVNDAKSFIDDTNHTAAMLGTVTSPALSDRPLTAIGGKFNLFVDDPAEPEIKRMEYSTMLVAEDGTAYRFEGFKRIGDDPGLDLWEDTTTLYIDVYETGASEDTLKGKGILKIEVADFVRQMTTLKANHGKGKMDRLEAVASFGRLFAGQLWDSYGHLASHR